MKYSGTQTHTVSFQFLGVLRIFFGQGWKHQKITQLYKNLSHVTLSGANEFSFDNRSCLISGLTFKLKGSTLANRDRWEKEEMASSKKILDETTFVELPDEFEQDLVDNLFKDLEHKKIEHPYVEPKATDAIKIEEESTYTNHDFNKLKLEFDKITNAATEQKKQNEVIDLIDYIIDDDNPF